jgi:hypothetical protein
MITPTNIVKLLEYQVRECMIEPTCLGETLMKLPVPYIAAVKMDNIPSTLPTRSVWWVKEWGDGGGGGGGGALVDNMPEDIVALLTESFFLSRFVAELTLIQGS